MKKETNVPIESIKLPTRMYTILHNVGIDKIQEIYDLDEESIFSMPGMGKQTAVDLNDYLVDKGYMSLWRTDNWHEFLIAMDNHGHMDHKHRNQKQFVDWLLRYLYSHYDGNIERNLILDKIVEYRLTTDEYIDDSFRKMDGITYDAYSEEFNDRIYERR